MSLVGGLLGLGRRFQSTQFTATVTIRRKTGESKDSATGKITPTWTDIYAGPAELVFGAAHPRDVDAAGQRLAEQQPTVKLPVDGEHAAAAAAVCKDDVGTVDASAHDAGAVGVTFRIAGIFGKSNATSRRLPVEVISHA